MRLSQPFSFPLLTNLRETTSSQETLVPQDTVPQSLLAFSGGNSCHHPMTSLLQGISQAALPPPGRLLWVRFPKTQPCPRGGSISPVQIDATLDKAGAQPA